MSDLQNRLTATLGREVNLNHEKVHEIVFELVGKLEQYQMEYKEAVAVIRRLYTEGEK
jgi:hypothetical protein